MRRLGVAGRKGLQEELDILISNAEGIWEHVAATRLECPNCAERHSCDLGGCFTHSKMVENTKIKLPNYLDIE